MPSDLALAVRAARLRHDETIRSLDDLFAPRRRILVSVSGGETSWRLAQLIRDAWSDHDLRFVFANTSLENEETLEFNRDCAAHFGIPLVWVEAVTYPELGKGVGWRAVDFRTASRNGEPFEDLIRKHGIPNQSFPHCSRELKGRVIRAYLRETGWKTGSYLTAIGIRADEIDRMTNDPAYIYPLIRRWPNTKPTINASWSRQPFRLRLKGYQGNCVTCWKKSLRKHLTLMQENPRVYDFMERMERLYGFVGPEQRRDLFAAPRRFFRGRLTVADLRHLATSGNFNPAEDDATVFDFELDATAGCSDSCEVTFD